jgi:hypothetical protein
MSRRQRAVLEARNIDSRGFDTEALDEWAARAAAGGDQELAEALEAVGRRRRQAENPPDRRPRILMLVFATTLLVLISFQTIPSLEDIKGFVGLAVISVLVAVWVAVQGWRVIQVAARRIHRALKHPGDPDAS